MASPMTELRKRKERLMALQADISRNIEMDRREFCTEVVQYWLSDVNRVFDQINNIEEEVRRPMRSRSGCFLRCCSQSDLRQRISELTREVTILSRSGDQFLDESVVSPGSEKGLEFPTPKLIAETTIQKTMKMVWECLMDDESWLIGVYGMGGVGKTTMMKLVNNRLLEEHQRFNKVIWVTIPKHASIRRLQDEVARAVGFHLSHEKDDDTRSSMLRKELSRKGRIVFILDDMWEAFSLHHIGIPDFTKDYGSKLVLTSRSLEVCQMMGCNKNIKLDLLSEEEAWKLFIGTVDTELVPEVEKIAKHVAEECSRLPLAIITIGATMKRRDNIGEWRVALRDLQESTKWIVNMEDRVIERLKFSYNRLGDDILKKCFLYVALYPEDYKLDSEELIDLWVMEGLINGSNIKDECDRGHIVLNKLKSSCMLEKYDYDYEDRLGEYLKMHDLIRDMAIDITKETPRFLVNADQDVKKLGAEMVLEEDYEKVSYVATSMNEILISPNWRGVRTLLLSHNYGLQRITHGFFAQIQGLKVLTLREASIVSLPESISDLIYLEALDLTRCNKLERVPSVEKLQLLRVLKLKGTALEELPHGMEALLNLKELDLTDTKLRQIPAILVSNLSSLQELLMRPLYLSSCLGDEFTNLIHFESLSVSFTSLSEYNVFTSSENFNRLRYFSFGVGDPLVWSLPIPHPTRSRSVYVCNIGRQNSKNVVIPRKTEYLHMEEFSDVRSLSELACSKNVKELRTCSVESFPEMEHILVPEEAQYLQNLEVMDIRGCPKLLTLCKGPNGSLPCLKKLIIWGCGTLSYVFSVKLIMQLQNLVEVVIAHCGDIEELVRASEEEAEKGSTSGNSIMLPCLKKLVMENLPKLKSIWNGAILCDSLLVVSVSECYELKGLPLVNGEEKFLAPALKQIRGERQWWDSLEWNRAHHKSYFQPFFRALDGPIYFV